MNKFRELVSNFGPFKVAVTESEETAQIRYLRDYRRHRNLVSEAEHVYQNVLRQNPPASVKKMDAYAEIVEWGNFCLGILMSEGPRQRRALFLMGNRIMRWPSRRLPDHLTRSISD